MLNRVTVTVLMWAGPAGNTQGISYCGITVTAKSLDLNHSSALFFFPAGYENRHMDPDPGRLGWRTSTNLLDFVWKKQAWSIELC